jgi:HTH-type transcriptional regulator/antitoxin HigA
MSENRPEIDQLLNSAFEDNSKTNVSLSELFDSKLAELKLKRTNVQNLLGIPSRTLKGILDGTQKMVDVTNIKKLADFLQLPEEQVYKLYSDTIQQKLGLASGVTQHKIKFIKENFNLIILKKAGLIDSLTDFDHIEKRIVARLGYKSIYEYQNPNIDVAFSSGVFKPKNLQARMFWLRTAMNLLEEINNPNEFDRDGLIKFIPNIIWHTQNVEKGLTEVIKVLYKLGITVVYQPPLQGLQLRGATLSINDKPCIVLTNYQGFYPTLWFCLLHEIFHVLFDFNDIKKGQYHLTDDENDELSVREREDQADNFAREYFFSRAKLVAIKPLLHNFYAVKRCAAENHIHVSFIYAFAAFDARNDRSYWARAKKFSPPVTEAVLKIGYNWSDQQNVTEFSATKKLHIFN